MGFTASQQYKQLTLSLASDQKDQKSIEAQISGQSVLPLLTNHNAKLGV